MNDDKQDFFSECDVYDNSSPWQRMIDERLIYEDARPEDTSK